jgi:hypothetical protein
MTDLDKLYLMINNLVTSSWKRSDLEKDKVLRLYLPTHCRKVQFYRSI